MRRILLFSLFLLTPGWIQAGPTSLVSLKTPDFEKPVLMYVPRNYEKHKKWGLVVALHGTGMNGGQMVSGMQPEILARHGYFTVFPTSNFRAWGTGHGSQVEDKKRELKALRLMIEAIEKKYAIDPNCVHVLGFSAGTLIGTHGIGFYKEWDGLKIRSLSGHGGAMAGKVISARPERKDETAIWVITGDLDGGRTGGTTSINQAFQMAEFDTRHDVAPGLGHCYPLVPMQTLLKWWRTLDGSALSQFPSPKDPPGIHIKTVVPDSMAEKFGLKPEDEVLSFNGIPIHNNPKQFASILRRLYPEFKTMTVIRDGEKITLSPLNLK